MDRKVVVQWTETAKEQLAKLPEKVRKGLLDKASRLRDADDPRDVHKALTGSLQGYYRITYARYRAVYTVEEQELADGSKLAFLRILFVVVGIRKERAKKDVYNVAKRIIKFGLGDEQIDEDEIDIQDSD